MRSKKEKAPAGIGVPNAGAPKINQVQNTPGACERQGLQETLIDTMRRIEGDEEGKCGKYGKTEYAEL